jgi:hopanoid biosynthesis associated protein HpnK
MAGKALRRLVINADDFGRSRSINEAVIRAHSQGVLTTASLMVNEPGWKEAVAACRDHPNLGIGLHLSLIDGRAALTSNQVPGLVNEQGMFTAGPVLTGLRYFGRRGLRAQLRQEMQAQVDRFHATGLPMDHLNGHLHLHLHPVVFDLLMEHAAEWKITAMRLTSESFWLSARLTAGHWAYRASHAAVFHFLSGRARGPMRSRNIRHTQQVFGLLQDGRVDEQYVLKLLPELPPGDSELYCHPSVDVFAHELAALISPRVRALLESLGITRIRYADL